MMLLLFPSKVLLRSNRLVLRADRRRSSITETNRKVIFMKWKPAK